MTLEESITVLRVYEDVCKWLRSGWLLQVVCEGVRNDFKLSTGSDDAAIQAAALAAVESASSFKEPVSVTLYFRRRPRYENFRVLRPNYHWKCDYVGYRGDVSCPIYTALLRNRPWRKAVKT